MLVVMQLVFWLEPSEPDRAFYQAIIDRLAQKYDVPKFAPHVTLYVDRYDPDRNIQALLEIVTNKITPITLEIENIQFSDLFTKTLFIQFRSDSMLHQLNESIRQQFSPPSGYVLNPHLSLIYSQTLSNNEKQQLASEIELRDRVMRFDLVSAIVGSDKVETPADIESCRVIGTQTLT
jgi:2'-5' RNA ligase